METFRYQPEKIVVGTLYHYEKSNIDGSQAHDIALYVAATDQIEAFKWHPGDDEGLLVVAKIDWATFCVIEFKSWQLDNTGASTLRGTTHFTVLKQADGANQLRISGHFGSGKHEQTLSGPDRFLAQL